MAGFFKLFDYTKPGPGVPKDQPPKNGILVFFEVLQRKFWDIIKLNILYNLFNLPALLMMFLGLQLMFPYVILDNLESDLFIRIFFGAVFLCIPTICIGPAQAGMTYVLRNYSREEHAFIWGDFKEHSLSNIKQSMLLCLIDFFFFLLFSVAINFYGEMINVYNWAFAAYAIILLVFIFFLMTHLFLYPMLVTFRLTLTQLYKNALIFSVLRFIPNLGILLVNIVFLLLTFIFPAVGILLYLLISPALLGLVNTSYSYRVLKKYMMKKTAEQQESDESQEDGELKHAVVPPKHNELQADNDN